MFIRRTIPIRTNSQAGNKRIIDAPPLHMGGYQQLLRGEPFRAKFRNSWEKPEPLTPGKEADINFTMPDLFHTFRRGHRIMVQVQSSWFPLTDRNPQTFTDIPNAQARGVPEGDRTGVSPEGRGQRRGSAGDAVKARNRVRRTAIRDECVTHHKVRTSYPSDLAKGLERW